ncbi:MAG: sodium/solute symporter [Phycisphaerae bacterium]|nr:sodium/solute symporter [Phycisphaerae bacterium]
MMLLASGVQALDWVIVGVYFVGVVGMGAYFARRQRSTKEYFLGSRSMSSWVVGLSIIATLLSTISYLANPGEMIQNGPGLFTRVLAIPIAYFIVAYWVIPFFMRLPITSAYEYLQERFGGETRTVGAVLFVLIRVIWMSVVVYTASGAMARMTGMRLELVIVCVGVFTTFYAAVGGIRAVIWTDVVQFIILLGGAVFAVGYIVWYMGLSECISVAVKTSKPLAPLWSWDPTTRLTLIGITMHYVSWVVCTYSADQVVIQRYLSTRDAQAARRSYLISCIGNIFLSTILAATGFALLAFYTQHPDLLGGSMSGQLSEQADDVFPYFIAHQLPVGVTGVITAALFAAAMSSLDSGVNSVSTVITVDFFQRWSRRQLSDETMLKFAKILGLALGLTATVLALFVDKIEGNILVITNKSTSCVVGPLFGLFALGMFTRRANQFGAIAGPAVGFVVGLIMTFSGQWFGPKYNISFMWLIITPTIITIASGYVLSLLRPAPTEKQLRFTRRAVMSGLPPVMEAGRAASGGFPVEETPDE